jgi:peptidoglycan/LPS O-acetylase OafA/YrhL
MSTTIRNFQPIDFKTRFPALDGIRALAVTIVFFNHYGGGSHGGFVLRLLNHLRENGWVGVDLFFVLSGFLITGILFDTRTDSHFFKRFFARRSLRIFPVFYLMFAILLLLTPLFHYQWQWLQLTFLVYFGNFFANYDFSLYELASPTHPAAKALIGHFWSLCVEEQFYLLWPLVVWTVRDRICLLRTAFSVCLLALLLRIAMCLIFPAYSERWIVRTLPFRMDSLLFGAALALLLRGPRSDLWQRSCKWIFLGGMALVVPLFLKFRVIASPWILTIGFTLLAVTATGLIGMTLRSGSPAFRFFYVKPLRIVGKYSYGFYLYHMIFQIAFVRLLILVTQKTHSLAIGGIIELSCAFGASFLVAKLSYDLFEVRFLRWKVQFEYDSELLEHEHAFTTK